MILTKKVAKAEPIHRSKARDNHPMLKKAYRKPRVRPVGKVEQTIMSPSPGTFESGNGGGFKP